MLLLLLVAVVLLIVLWTGFIPEFRIVRVRFYPGRIVWTIVIVLILLGLFWMSHKLWHSK
jgi:hypothetical protein